jgi:hypothetical protein
MGEAHKRSFKICPHVFAGVSQLSAERDSLKKKWIQQRNNRGAAFVVLARHSLGGSAVPICPFQCPSRQPLTSLAVHETPAMRSASYLRRRQTVPDQPDDPLHYEMKIPPEPKDAPLSKEEQHSESDKASDESDTPKRPGKNEGGVNPSPSSGH